MKEAATNHSDDIAPDPPAWLKRHLEKIPDTLTYHRAHPEISFDAHMMAQKRLLGQRVLAKKRIYLDQKYWIYCRDAALGRPAKPEHAELLSVIRRSVTNGIALCPVAHPVLEETFKQSDPLTRKATADIIDELSMNVTLAAR